MTQQKNILRDTGGATAVEYALILLMVALGTLLSVQGLGNSLKTTFNNTSSSMLNTAS